MARALFGMSIRYERVRVHRRRFLPCSGDNAMTPFGAIYFPPAAHRDDFSQADDGTKVWFMHEMAHVWQYQQGLSVLYRGLCLGLRGGYGRGAPAYAYDPHVQGAHRLQDFNLEQQAELLAHYFDARFLNGRVGTRHEQRVRLLPFYECVLGDFLCRPNDSRLLPRR